MRELVEGFKGHEIARSRLESRSHRRIVVLFSVLFGAPTCLAKVLTKAEAIRRRRLLPDP